MQNAMEFSASSPSVTLTSFTTPHPSEQASSTHQNTTEGCTSQPTAGPAPQRFDFTFGFSGTLTPTHHLWGHFENAVRTQYLYMDVMAFYNALHEHRRRQDQALVTELLNQVQRMSSNVNKNRNLLKRRVDVLEGKLDEAEGRIDLIQHTCAKHSTAYNTPTLQRHPKIEAMVAKYFPIAERQHNLPCGLLTIPSSPRPVMPSPHVDDPRSPSYRPTSFPYNLPGISVTTNKRPKLDEPTTTQHACPPAPASTPDRSGTADNEEFGQITKKDPYVRINQLFNDCQSGESSCTTRTRSTPPPTLSPPHTDSLIAGMRTRFSQKRLPSAPSSSNDTHQ
jgi:hypothetical protein